MWLLKQRSDERRLSNVNVYEICNNKIQPQGGSDTSAIVPAFESASDLGRENVSDTALPINVKINHVALL